MALIDTVKVALRVTSEVYDPEIEAYVAAGKLELEARGVPAAMLSEESMDPLCQAAVISYCKWRFGYDNDDAATFREAFEDLVRTMLNMPTRYRTDDAGGGGE